jgi:hypothetical protein
VRTYVTLLLLLALPTLGLVACTDVRGIGAGGLGDGDPVDDGPAGDVDRIRFCLDLARMEAAIEAGSPETAAETAQELLARAPEDLRTDARGLAERLRGTPSTLDTAIEDPEVRELTARLREGAGGRCDLPSD